jgi:hypothetical protein
MFVRASAWWHAEPLHNSDARFLHAEAYATFWAAAALSDATVINRPGLHGTVGRMTYGEISSKLLSHRVNLEKEVYASGPEFIAHEEGSMWGEDANFLSAPVPQLPPKSPLRARKLDPRALYEIVTVVGKHAFPATTDRRSVELDLGAQSISLAQRANVKFATVTWAVEDSGATPVRLNASPEESEVRYAWAEISDALCEELFL